MRDSNNIPILQSFLTFIVILLLTAIVTLKKNEFKCPICHEKFQALFTKKTFLEISNHKVCKDCADVYGTFGGQSTTKDEIYVLINNLIGERKYEFVETLLMEASTDDFHFYILMLIENGTKYYDKERSDFLDKIFKMRRQRYKNEENVVKGIGRKGSDSKKSLLHRCNNPLDAEVLLKNGVKANHIDYQGRNVMHYAVANKNIVLLNFYSTHSATIGLCNSRDNNWHTPHHYAAAMKDKDYLIGKQMMKTFEENPACKPVTDKEGKTALEYATLKTGVLDHIFQTKFA